MKVVLLFNTQKVDIFLQSIVATSLAIKLIHVYTVYIRFSLTDSMSVLIVSTILRYIKDH